MLVHIFGGFRDLFGTSPRRCLALTQLTFREAVRRKTLWVFAVFAVLFLFAGWFLSDVTADAELQVKNYVSFVLRTIKLADFAGGAAPGLLGASRRYQGAVAAYGRHQTRAAARNRSREDPGLHRDRRGNSGRHGGSRLRLDQPAVARIDARRS